MRIGLLGNPASGAACAVHTPLTLIDNAARHPWTQTPLTFFSSDIFEFRADAKL
jgi:hypothetical protein